MGRYSDKAEVKDLAVPAEGWISPSGDLYLCDYRGHENSASEIARTILGLERESTLDRWGDRLMGLGWVRVYHDSILFNKTLAQAQIDTIFDMLQHLSEQKFYPGLRESIKKALGMPHQWFTPGNPGDFYHYRGIYDRTEDRPDDDDEEDQL